MFQFLKSLFGGGSRIDFGELIANGATVVDVRSQAEYQGGHLKNSLNLPLDGLATTLAKLDRTRPVITCCASGIRSGAAKRLLLANGFAEVHNGGGWASLRPFMG